MEQELNIRAFRQRNGWTQEKLAELLGVDRSSISRMENGAAVRGPVRKLLLGLAKLPDCEVELGAE